MLTLPRFTEMSIELGIFQKEHVLKYGEGSEELKNKWEKEKSNIKYRYIYCIIYYQIFKSQKILKSSTYILRIRKLN